MGELLSLVTITMSPAHPRCKTHKVAHEYQYYDYLSD